MSDRPQPPGGQPQAVGIVALLVGSVGAAATLVPLLRVAGVLVGLIGAILGTVTLITRGLGGKALAAGGLAVGLAALPLAITLYVTSARLDSDGRQRAAPATVEPSLNPSIFISPLPATPSCLCTTSTPAPVTSPPGHDAVEMTIEVIGKDGATSAAVSHHVEGRWEPRKEARLPYRHEFTTRRPSSMLVSAVTQRGTITCRIRLNGKVVHERSRTGSPVACSAWYPT